MKYARMKKVLSMLLSVICILLLSSLVSAATLHGSIYNLQLNLESDVLVKIDTIPPQKELAKDGTYTFELAPGKYTLTAQKEALEIHEEVDIITDGNFVFDLFLLPDLTEEDELWRETEGAMFDDETELLPKKGDGKDSWRYWAAAIIIGVLFWRFMRVRRKYGSLRKFRKKAKEEQAKTPEQHKEEIAKEPGYLEEVLEVIKKHDGRITQKELRKEMLHLSEAKVSLILTELEHKGKIEKIKKGRGNVIFLR